MITLSKRNDQQDCTRTTTLARKGSRGVLTQKMHNTSQGIVHILDTNKLAERKDWQLGSRTMFGTMFGTIIVVGKQLEFSVCTKAMIKFKKTNYLHYGIRLATEFIESFHPRKKLVTVIGIDSFSSVDFQE